MERLVDKGKTRLIGEFGVGPSPLVILNVYLGMSNFNILKLRRILQNARIRPAVNQVELHP